MAPRYQKGLRLLGQRAPARARGRETASEGETGREELFSRGGRIAGVYPSSPCVVGGWPLFFFSPWPRSINDFLRFNWLPQNRSPLTLQRAGRLRDGYSALLGKWSLEDVGERVGGVCENKN